MPKFPRRIGVVSSPDGAAIQDVLHAIERRDPALQVVLAPCRVQGMGAAQEIAAAINLLNDWAYSDGKAKLDLILVTRGGGSAEDLGAFSTEQVTRVVAGSRTPTIVAIGHEVDISLAELAADQRGSTPSNAAELLVPDKRHVLDQLKAHQKSLIQALDQNIIDAKSMLENYLERLQGGVDDYLRESAQNLGLRAQVLQAFNPSAALKRGYAVLRSGDEIIKSVASIKIGQSVSITIKDGKVDASITSIKPET